MDANDLAQLYQASEFDKELLWLMNMAPTPPPQWPLAVWPCPHLNDLTTDELRQLVHFWRQMRARESQLREQQHFINLDLALQLIYREASAARLYLRQWRPPSARYAGTGRRGRTPTDQDRGDPDE